MPPPAPSSNLDRARRLIADERTGGVLLLIAALVAVFWSNSPWRATYASLSATEVGPEALHLHLSLATWAADGLLAIFFFLVGVELKHEATVGSLRHPKEAGVPVLAAVGGMALPALLYIAVVLSLGDAAGIDGWAIPTATDIAFALAVLAVFGRGLPRALRLFLLTLAAVDDLLAILVIALFFTDHIDLLALAAALAAVAVFALLVRRRRWPWWLLVPVALVAWSFMHASGVHATIAGVLLGFCVPAVAVHGEPEPRTHVLDDAIRPVSACIALPVFAFFAAGVNVVDSAGDLLAQPVFLATMAGLVIGKLVGVIGTTALVTALTPLRLPDAIGLRDLVPIGFLTGIGFTVSLLITELSFDKGAHHDAAKVGILLGSLLAGVLGALALRWDAQGARSADMNRDGIDDTDTGPIE